MTEPTKRFMKPGTKVLARRFGREILAEVTASGGSTFTVAALAEDDYTCWQDMTFDDVAIVEPEDDETVLIDTGSFFARVPKRKDDEVTGDGDPKP